MTDDTTGAFGALEARTAPLDGDRPPDRLILRDHVVTAEIGAFQHERGATQRLRFNVVVELAQRREAGDDVDRILSYDRITDAIADELAAERLNLVETLAERIAARVLAEPQAIRVFLRIEKLDLGPGALGVEIVRDGGSTVAVDAAPHVRPAVHLVESAALAAAPEGPAVIVPPAPHLPLPAAASAAAQRQIALLALEQEAWSLASRHRELRVVATRTEMDWALKRGQTVIWAPTKLVLDTPGAPEAAEPGVLAVWLADLLGARGLTVHGAVAVPAGCRVPISRA